MTYTIQITKNEIQIKTDNLVYKQIGKSHRELTTESKDKKMLQFKLEMVGDLMREIVELNK